MQELPLERFVTLWHEIQFNRLSQSKALAQHLTEKRMQRHPRLRGRTLGYRFELFIHSDQETFVERHQAAFFFRKASRPASRTSSACALNVRFSSIAVFLSQRSSSSDKYTVNCVTFALGSLRRFNFIVTKLHHYLLLVNMHLQINV